MRKQRKSRVGPNARVVRDMKGKKQSTVAEAIGISRSQLCKFEQGYVDIYMEQALALAHELGVSLQFLQEMGQDGRLYTVQVSPPPGME